MWAYGQHFRVENVDKHRATLDCGIMASFKQQSRASARDLNLLDGELDYVGKIQDILEVNLRSFTIILFHVQWFQVIQRGPNRTVRRDPNGFYAIDSSKLLRKNEDPFALPQHCEQIFFHPDILDDKWLYVVHVTPRGRRAFENQVSYEESPAPSTTHVESEDEDKDEDAHEDENANEVEEDNDVNHCELEHDPMIENNNDVMEHDEDIDIDVCAMRDLYLDET
jgi:hypothetical protein